MSASPVIATTQWCPDGNPLHGAPSLITRLLASDDGKTRGYGYGSGRSMIFGHEGGGVTVEPRQWVNKHLDGTFSVSDEPLGGTADVLPVSCPDCGGNDLRWDFAVAGGDVADGRLAHREFRIVAYLGCESCSATVRTMGMKQLSHLLTSGSLTGDLTTTLADQRAALRKIAALKYDGTDGIADLTLDRAIRKLGGALDKIGDIILDLDDTLFDEEDGS